MKSFKSIFTGATLIMALGFSCTPPSPPPVCSSVGTDELCMEDQIFQLNIKNCQADGNYFDLYLCKHDTATTSEAQLSLSCFLFDGINGSMPQLGTYYGNSATIDTMGTDKQFLAGGIIYGPSSMVEFVLDTTGNNVLNITSVGPGMFLYGNAEFRVYNLYNPSDVRNVKANFSNVACF